MNNFGLYLHIPFCKKKCNYCDFVSYANKETLIDDYVKALIRELEFLFSIFDFRLSTIYFGGGTPTLLEPHHFEIIIKYINSSFVIRHSSLEMSVEANPGTANKAKLKALRQLGINRLSIGAQTFNDQHLKTLGRIHNSRQIFEFYDNARSAGFDNVNFDLIFALPDQTLAQWQEDLKIAISLKPNHLSTYNLQVEEGTPLWEMTNDKCQMSNEGKIIKEETELAMYEYTIETLTSHGYKHYEISNFAQPSFECQHNINYWKNGNYIGVGAGAHSHINGQRWANPDSIEEYLKGKHRATKAETGCVTDKNETIFMGLRLMKGLDIEKFVGFEKEVSELIEDGLLMRSNGHYKLTRQGLYLANLVFEKFV